MNPDPKLLDDYFSLGFVLLVVAAFLAVVIGVWLGRIIREGQMRYDDRLEDLNADIDRQRIAYHCRAHGHAFCHPELHNGQRVFRCENCGDAVVSGPGWIDGGAS